LGITANAFLLALLAVGVLTPLSSPRAEMITGQQNMQYDVYAGGIHALQSNLAIDLSNKNTYSVNLKAKTYGLLGKMAPWAGTYFTKGWSGDSFKPEQHIAASTWRGQEETKEYRYNKDGSFGGYNVTKDNKKPVTKNVGAELTDNTSDLLSATLNTMQAIATKGKCEGSSEIFDGKRRFKLIFKQVQKVEMSASRWNVYEGSAIECTAEVEPITGKWHEKPRGWLSIQEQGRERGTMPTIWLAQITDGQPAVPVKMRVKTSYGTLFMHMTKYETAGKTLTLKK